MDLTKLRIYDAHNHLQDDRFGGRESELLATCDQEGVVQMVVNGSCEEDWPAVLKLARSHPQVIASFGYHPWNVHERTRDWQEILTRHLDQIPSAVGEIGLDRWKPDLPYDDQEAVFIAQLRLAAERNLPVSIHCLQAWGRLLELLGGHPRPQCGFLLHSYGGPQEMVAAFVKLGAYFSLPGYFAHERKSRQRETFQHIPPDRLLIETDAPDQGLPERPSEAGEKKERGLAYSQYEWTDAATGKRLNHPANLAAVYQFAATLRAEPLEALASQIEQNFHRLFGRVAGKPAGH